MAFKNFELMLEELKLEHYESDYVENMIHNEHMNISNDEIVRLYNIYCKPDAWHKHNTKPL